jgi:hypothetical protein
MADEQDMDLKMFVTTTLVQIIEGVQEAIKQISPSGSSAKINPTSNHALYSDPKDVNFDVAVTVADKVSGEGKAGLKVMSIEIGGGGGKISESEAVSRIQFSVPVSVPSTSERQYKESPAPDRHPEEY